MQVFFFLLLQHKHKNKHKNDLSLKTGMSQTVCIKTVLLESLLLIFSFHVNFNEKTQVIGNKTGLHQNLIKVFDTSSSKICNLTHMLQSKPHVATLFCPV